jgi:tetratricopeptide (TPR) repeat protein
MRNYAITAAVALAAAGITVGLTLATRTTVPKPAVQAQAGRPPLVLDLGVRIDPEAVALRDAANEYDAGKIAAAAKVFGRYRSPEAQVGSAFASWPGGFDRLAALAGTDPSSLVQLNYGLGLYWRGDTPAARTAWRKARRAQPDTSYALRAEDLLYPKFPRGLPTFVPSFLPPAELAKLSPPKQLEYLRAHATDDRGRLLLGVAYQRLGRRLSAIREFDRATGSEAEVAQAVGRFDKADPSRTFSRLGPLAKRYPRSQSVRFHLGLCLLWLGSVDQAKQELRQARDLGPRTPLGTESRRFLERLAEVGSR